jgi:hypothetical protein
VTAATKPPGTKVEFEVLAEPDRLLHSKWLGSHGYAQKKLNDFTPVEKERPKCNQSWRLAGHKT